MNNASTGGRPSKNERREQAREQARELREAARKKEKRNRILLQSGIIVGILAVAAVVVLIIVSSVKPASPGPQNMASDGLLIQAGGEVLRHGEAVLTDLAYLDRGVGLRRGEPLEHERRLLDRWFDEQITSAGQ